jgi:hypothetical protein
MDYKGDAIANDERKTGNGACHPADKKMVTRPKSITYDLDKKKLFTARGLKGANANQKSYPADEMAQ